MNRRRNRLILSERAALQERRAREKDRLLAELQPGETRSGSVSSICDFGAFVDLGGADGLVHLSELSWGQVSHPSQVVKVGRPRRGVRRRRGPREQEDRALAEAAPGRAVEPGQRQVPGGPGRQRPDHQAGRVRRLRRDRAGHRGADPHLGAVRGADHPPEAGRARRRRAAAEDHPDRAGPASAGAEPAAGRRGAVRRVRRGGTYTVGRRRGRRLATMAAPLSAYGDQPDAGDVERRARRGRSSADTVDRGRCPSAGAGRRRRGERRGGKCRAIRGSAPSEHRREADADVERS